MKIEVSTKFEIGEIVQIRGTKMLLSIGGIHAEACPGGIQILYKGIVLFPNPRSFKENADFVMEPDKRSEMFMNEILLEPKGEK